MKNNDDTLTAELISTFDHASHFLSDCYYADQESELWFCRWQSREFEIGASIVESLIRGDMFVSDEARKTVHESLDWFRDFLQQRGYSFQCMKVESLIDRVNKAGVVAP